MPPIKTATHREKLAVVIPTLNEAENIPTLINRLHGALAKTNVIYELIVVDDGSHDGTAEVAQRYADQDPRIRVFVRKGVRGLAGAVLHGWSHTDSTLLGVIDADLQHPPEVLPALVRAIQKGNDIAIASRYAVKEMDSVGNWNGARRLISKLGTWVTMPLQRSNVRVKDPLSGFFVVRRSAIDGLSLQPEGFKILLEILVKGNIQKAAEVPFHFATRHAGKSKADVRVALQYFSLLGKLSRHAILRLGQ
jgi:dolichol-phosphate mannosyltransferase